MKKITLGLLTAMLTCMGVSARQISPGEALDLALEFMKSSELQTASSGKTILRAMKAPGVNGDVANPYYVFNRGENEGFVIISGDDRAPKILGYSDKGSFDVNNLPPQLKAMMEQWAAQMSKLPESVRQHASWSREAKTRSGEEVLLETANWGQGFPYNASCPIVEGANCVTGCVATAMAIVMKYHNWPETYDWSSMPMNTEKDPLDYEVVNPALSGLMADAGEAVYMEYSPFESGADMNWVGHRLQYTFHYSPECQFISSENFPKEKWEAMIKDNIDNHSPVIYSGNGTGAHAFVLDGYNDIVITSTGAGTDGIMDTLL